MWLHPWIHGPPGAQNKILVWDTHMWNSSQYMSVPRASRVLPLKTRVGGQYRSCFFFGLLRPAFCGWSKLGLQELWSDAKLGRDLPRVCTNNNNKENPDCSCLSHHLPPLTGNIEAWNPRLEPSANQASDPLLGVCPPQLLQIRIRFASLCQKSTCVDKLCKKFNSGFIYVLYVHADTNFVHVNSWWF